MRQQHQQQPTITITNIICYSNCVNSIKSEATRRNYIYSLRKYMEYKSSKKGGRNNPKL
jgi:hypothetical protein